MNNEQNIRRIAFKEIFKIEKRIFKLHKENHKYLEKYFSRNWIHFETASVISLKDQCLIQKVKINDLIIEKLGKLKHNEDLEQINIEINNAKQSLSIIIC